MIAHPTLLRIRERIKRQRQRAEWRLQQSTLCGFRKRLRGDCEAAYRERSGVAQSSKTDVGAILEDIAQCAIKSI
jgi:hypothetical protein